MKTIVTAIGAFRTGTEIADAVTAYGLALARVRALDVVDIPFVTADGSIHRAELRIGWRVETAVTSDGELAAELVDVDTIFDLITKSISLSPRRNPTDNRRRTDLSVGTNWDELI